tara:strand:+ start:1099 stop:1221 length:123 start_codon:yes stop_codon:yes gene_type:complete
MKGGDNMLELLLDGWHKDFLMALLMVILMLAVGFYPWNWK